MKLLVCIFIIHQVITIGAKTLPCPFNENDCTCVQGIFQPKTSFSKVTCNATSFPSFQSLPDQKYNVTGAFRIVHSDMSRIPANHFSAFQIINILYLIQDPELPPKPQQWDDHAFDDVEISAIIVIGLDGLIPVPKAVKNLPNLISYEVISAPSAVNYQDNSIQGSSLIILETVNTTISSINKNAFSGADGFGWINFYQTGLSYFTMLTAALRNVQEFSIMDLEKNQISEIKAGDLDGLKQLCWLNLDKNPLTNIQQGAFTSELENLKVVMLDNTELESLDLGLFSQVKSQSFGANKIGFLLTSIGSSKLSHLTTTVTDKFPAAAYVNLWYSNLETIDSKISNLLDNVPDLMIDVSFNSNLKCDSLNWMSKIDCPGRMVIENATCANHNNQPLYQYLKSVDPNSKCQDGSGPGYLIGCSVGGSENGRNMNRIARDSDWKKKNLD